MVISDLCMRCKRFPTNGGRCDLWDVGGVDFTWCSSFVKLQRGYRSNRFISKKLGKEEKKIGKGIGKNLNNEGE